MDRLAEDFGRRTNSDAFRVVGGRICSRDWLVSAVGLTKPNGATHRPTMYPSKVDAKCKSRSAALSVGFSEPTKLLLLKQLTCWRAGGGGKLARSSRSIQITDPSLYSSSIAPHSIYGIAPFIIFMLCTYGAALGHWYSIKVLAAALCSRIASSLAAGT